MAFNPPEEILPQLERISQILQRSPTFRLSPDTVRKLASWLGFQVEPLTPNAFSLTGTLISIAMTVSTEPQANSVTVSFPHLTLVSTFTSSVEAILEQNLHDRSFHKLHQNLTMLALLDRLSIHNFDLFHYYDTLCDFVGSMDNAPSQRPAFAYWSQLGQVSLNHRGRLGLHLTYYEANKYVNQFIPRDQYVAEDATTAVDQCYRLLYQIAEVEGPYRPFAITQSFESLEEVVGLQAAVVLELQPLVYVAESVLIAWGGGYTEAHEKLALHPLTTCLAKDSHMEVVVGLRGDTLEEPARKVTLQMDYLVDGLRLVPVTALNLPPASPTQLAGVVRTLRNWVFLNTILQNFQTGVEHARLHLTTNEIPSLASEEVLLADFLSDPHPLTTLPTFQLSIRAGRPDGGLHLGVRYRDRASSLPLEWELAIEDGEVIALLSPVSESEGAHLLKFLRMLNQTEDLLECVTWL